jgi:branched-chain amino acid aminotransferase
MAYPLVDALAGSHVLLDGELLPVASEKVKRLQEPVSATMYYEVIRVTRGVPLFFNDHIKRLARSVAGQLDLPDDLLAASRRLLQANKLAEINLRIVLAKGSAVLHLAPSYYPERAAVEQGVLTGVLDWERPEPNIKLVDPAYKLAVKAGFARKGPLGAYTELLLANHQGKLTEGSRTNLFFIRGAEVISAPDKYVLLGITRQYVEKAIKMAGLKLSYAMYSLAELEKATIKSAFISGSPIDVLPLRAIEDFGLDSARDPAWQRIYAAYMQIVEDYIRQHQA